MSLLNNNEIKYGSVSEDSLGKKPDSWGARHTFVLMAFLGCANIYAMRVNLSVAIVAMVGGNSNKNDSQMGWQCAFTNTSTLDRQKENEGFPWDAQDQGLILGAFFYGYVITQIPGGYLAEKYGGKWLFGIGTFITAVLTLLTPVAAKASLSALIALRVLEGLGEGVTYPAMQAMISKWLPSDERSQFSSIIWAGAQAGTMIALPISGLLADELNWESVFYFFGTLAAIWFAFWTLLCSNAPETHSRISSDERSYILANIQSKNEGRRLPFPPLWSMLKSPAFVSLILVHFGHNWGLYTLLTEIPTYLNNVQHFPLKANGFLSALPYFLMWIFAGLIGYLADFLINRNILSTVNVRRICNSIGHYGSAFGLIGLAFTGCDKTAAVIWLCISVGLNGATYSGYQVNHIELSPNYCGTLFGITNMIANLTGFITPWVAGNITNGNQSLEAWRTVFLIAAGLYIALNTVFIIFIKSEVQPWNSYWENIDENDDKVKLIQENKAK